MIDLEVTQSDIDLLAKTAAGRKLLLKFHKSLGEMTAVIKEIHKYTSKRRDNIETGGVVLYDYKW